MPTTREVLVLQKPEQLRALGSGARWALVERLREQTCSVSDLAEFLAMPKGTVGYHVKVLEKAGLIRIVRTRKVRALTEKYYGVTARSFAIRDSTFVQARLAEADARRIASKLDQIVADFRAADSEGGDSYTLNASLSR